MVLYYIHVRNCILTPEFHKVDDDTDNDGCDGDSNSSDNQYQLGRTSFFN